MNSEINEIMLEIDHADNKKNLILFASKALLNDLKFKEIYDKLFNNFYNHSYKKYFKSKQEFAAELSFLLELLILYNSFPELK